ncbi:MAG: hypothetical protein HY914_22340 [Desulfomonile tiedjei]|nr:hypothetical protein [Desulfomonile tiedjei]
MGDSSDRDRNGVSDSRRETGKAEPTIVGGRPPGRGSGVRKIPRGIDVLIKKASIDPEFRAILLEKRADAAAEIDLDLSPAEAATLNAVPRSQIEKIIETATVPDEQRRIFLGKAAAAMLAVLCMPVLAIAWEFQMTGHREDRLRYFGRARRRIVAQRLGVHILSEGPNGLVLSVHYSCPFDQGEIAIMFRDRDDSACPFVRCAPVRAVVSKGEGEVHFQVRRNGGTTEWLVIRLGRTGDDDPGEKTSALLGTRAKYSVSPFNKISDSAKYPPLLCPPPGLPESEYIDRRQLPLWPPAKYRPGEFLDGDRAIYRVEQFRRIWPSDSQPLLTDEWE